MLSTHSRRHAVQGLGWKEERHLEFGSIDRSLGLNEVTRVLESCLQQDP